jgi:hypothetical protein
MNSIELKAYTMEFDTNQLIADLRRDYKSPQEVHRRLFPSYYAKDSKPMSNRPFKKASDEDLDEEEREHEEEIARHREAVDALKRKRFDAWRAEDAWSRYQKASGRDSGPTQPTGSTELAGRNVPQAGEGYDGPRRAHDEHPARNSFERMFPDSARITTDTFGIR